MDIHLVIVVPGEPSPPLLTQQIPPRVNLGPSTPSVLVLSFKEDPFCNWLPKVCPHLVLRYPALPFTSQSPFVWALRNPLTGYPDTLPARPMSVHLPWAVLVKLALLVKFGFSIYQGNHRDEDLMEGKKKPSQWASAMAQLSNPPCRH